MAQRPLAQQPSVGLQELHNLWIRLQHMLAGKFLHDIGKPPAVVDRRQNLQPFARRGRGIVLKNKNVVFHAVTRRNMNTAGSLIEGHEVAE